MTPELARLQSIVYTMIAIGVIVFLLNLMTYCHGGLLEYVHIGSLDRAPGHCQLPDR
jgi:hypothetical protein